MGHQAIFLEPLTYASAWIFEHYGFAYVRGHKLMDDIHLGFQPGGKLYEASFKRHRGRGAMAEQISQMFDVFTRKYGLNRDMRPLSAARFRRPVTEDKQLRLF